MRQVLESFERKAAVGDPVKNPQAWLWRTVHNQCRQHGLRFEKMLAHTELPAELRAWKPESRAPVERAMLERRADAARVEGEAEDLELRFGDVLDDLSQADLEDLAGEARVDRGIFPLIKRDGLLRITLLMALANRVLS